MPITSLAQLDPNGTYSYADYLTWQFEELVELLRGKVVRRVSTPVELHQATVGELLGAFGIYLRRQRCQVRVGPYDVRLPQRGITADQAIYTVVQPDICDPTKIERLGCLSAPDLIIEVISPGTATRDWKDKFDLYEEAGVGEYWIVAPGDCWRGWGSGGIGFTNTNRANQEEVVWKVKVVYYRRSGPIY